MKAFKIILVLSVLFFNNYAVCASDSILNVKEHGVKGDGKTDDLPAIQKCIELASAKKSICYFPDGVYLMKGNLYLVSNLKLKGQNKSVLKFISGGILGEKSNQKQEYYTNNYNNEFVPNQKASKILKATNNSILIANSKVFKVNDDVVIFNGVKNSWEILEDRKRSTMWNTDKINEMARGGSFKITAINKNGLSTTPKVSFGLSSNSIISKRAGVVNVEVSNLTVNSDKVNYAILLEQPRNVVLNNLVITGKGGVMLTHYANKCKISSCTITTTNNASISIENFSSGNLVQNNNISFTKGSTFQSGSDAAIIILLSSFNNEISNNSVNCGGVREKDEGGIFVHALSYNNVVHNNKITGASEGIGIYYGAYNNKFTNNQIQAVKVGINSYYARQSFFDANQIVINSSRPGNKVGILSFGSNSNNYTKNNISGTMVFGVVLQSSSDFLTSNVIAGPGINVYSVGLKIVGNSTNANSILSANTFNDFKLKNQ